MTEVERIPAPSSPASFRVIYAGPPSALKLKHYEHRKIKINLIRAPRN